MDRLYMIRPYHTNSLTVTEITEYSVYADGGEYGDFPIQETPDGIKVGDSVEAFVYLDSADDIVATMAKAYVEVGECAYLEVVSSGDRGTFLDWGLPKDLLLPFSEQLGAVRKGNFCAVYVYQDENQTPVASMKLHWHLDEHYGDLELNEAVELMVAGESELGFKVVINNEQLGLIYHEELAQPLQIGTKMKGWVKKIRDDGKINININKLDTETRDELEDAILTQLKENDGRLNLSDKSSPDLIYARFNVSKKNFKRALGSLYKKRMITISPKFIELPAEE
jgi:predicted RNA-binding protein (virulence factor B family)